MITHQRAFRSSSSTSSRLSKRGTAPSLSAGHDDEGLGLGPLRSSESSCVGSVPDSNFPALLTFPWVT